MSSASVGDRQLTLRSGQPFGGIRASGEGLEMGAEGLRGYLDTRTFTLAQHRD